MGGNIYFLSAQRLHDLLNLFFPLLGNGWSQEPVQPPHVNNLVMKADRSCRGSSRAADGMVFMRQNPAKLLSNRIQPYRRSLGMAPVLTSNQKMPNE